MSLRDTFFLFAELGIPIARDPPRRRRRAQCGAVKKKQQIQADVYGHPVELLAAEEGGFFERGAARRSRSRHGLRSRQRLHRDRSRRESGRTEERRRHGRRISTIPSVVSCIGDIGRGLNGGAGDWCRCRWIWIGWARLPCAVRKRGAGPSTCRYHDPQRGRGGEGVPVRPSCPHDRRDPRRQIHRTTVISTPNETHFALAKKKRSRRAKTSSSTSPSPRPPPRRSSSFSWRRAKACSRSPSTTVAGTATSWTVIKSC